MESWLGHVQGFTLHLTSTVSTPREKSATSRTRPKQHDGHLRVGISTAASPAHWQRREYGAASGNWSMTNQTGNARQVYIYWAVPPFKTPDFRETWGPGPGRQIARCLARGLEYSRRDGHRTPQYLSISRPKSGRETIELPSTTTKREGNHRVSRAVA